MASASRHHIWPRELFVGVPHAHGGVPGCAREPVGARGGAQKGRRRLLGKSTRERGHRRDRIWQKVFWQHLQARAARGGKLGGRRGARLGGRGGCERRPLLAPTARQVSDSQGKDHGRVLQAPPPALRPCARGGFLLPDGSLRRRIHYRLCREPWLRCDPHLCDGGGHVVDGVCRREQEARAVQHKRGQARGNHPMVGEPELGGPSQHGQDW
mmetsp:Transcript_22971/g.58054  ORF Transcript_22971/g.58054 Transcript_22971/m.58054 type:complete len:212 (-) Transcript_22971:376-1011(-)